MIITIRFIKYCVVGTITTLEGWAIVWLLTEFCKMWYIHSSMIGTPIVLITAFVLNSWWTWGRNNDNEIQWINKILRRFMK